MPLKQARPNSGRSIDVDSTLEHSPGETHLCAALSGYHLADIFPRAVQMTLF